MDDQWHGFQKLSTIYFFSRDFRSETKEKTENKKRIFKYRKQMRERERERNDCPVEFPRTSFFSLLLLTNSVEDKFKFIRMCTFVTRDRTDVVRLERNRMSMRGCAGGENYLV